MRNKEHIVTNREKRQELLKQLTEVRWKKEVSVEYGCFAEYHCFAAEEDSILLELKLLKLPVWR